MNQGESEKLQEDFPSMCWKCVNARKPAAESNRDKGYVGCAEYVRRDHHEFISNAKELAEGWVDLRSRIFGEKSGIITNCQLLTFGVNKCSAFELEKERKDLPFGV